MTKVEVCEQHSRQQNKKGEIHLDVFRLRAAPELAARWLQPRDGELAGVRRREGPPSGRLQSRGHMWLALAQLGGSVSSGPMQKPSSSAVSKKATTLTTSRNLQGPFVTHSAHVEAGLHNPAIVF